MRNISYEEGYLPLGGVTLKIALQITRIKALKQAWLESLGGFD